MMAATKNTPPTTEDDNPPVLDALTAGGRIEILGVSRVWDTKQHSERSSCAIR
jgi:hypothetical protein